MILGQVLLSTTGAVALRGTVDLLLPGFQGRALEASIITQNGSTTTFHLTCPKTVDPSVCGLSGEGITAISAPTSAEIRHIKGNVNTASVSCDIAGTTYASCLARETISAQATLAAKDINWMNIPIVTPDAETIFAPPTLPTSIGGDITTQNNATIGTPKSINAATRFDKASRALYNVTASMVAASVGSLLMLAFFDWRMPPFPFF